MCAPSLMGRDICSRSLLRHAADVSAVWHSRHVCSVTQQQTCLLCHIADTSAASHDIDFCCSVECTGPLPTSEVKRLKARIVPGRQAPFRPVIMLQHMSDNICSDSLLYIPSSSILYVKDPNT